MMIKFLQERPRKLSLDVAGHGQSIALQSLLSAKVLKERDKFKSANNIKYT